MMNYLPLILFCYALTPCYAQNVPTNEAIVINEILFNPFPDDKDFVEIFNRSDVAYELKDLRLSSLKNGEFTTLKIISDTSLLLNPQSYLAITTGKEGTVSRYPNSISQRIIEVSSLPPYYNEQGTVILCTKDSLVVSSFTYHEDMHYKLLNDVEGISLERVYPDRSSNDVHNWTSASSLSGFATPGGVNSQYAELPILDGILQLRPHVFTPDFDGIDDLVNIGLQLPAAGYAGSVFLFDEAGRMQRVLINNELLGQQVWTSWDGVNGNGLKLPVGVYIIYLSAYHPSGDIITAKATCVIGKR